MTENCECQYNSAVYVCITIAAVENNQTFIFLSLSHRIWMSVFVTNAHNDNGRCQIGKCVRSIAMPIE